MFGRWAGLPAPWSALIVPSVARNSTIIGCGVDDRATIEDDPSGRVSSAGEVPSEKKRLHEAYLRLRRGIGLLGVGLPVVMSGGLITARACGWAAGEPTVDVLPSISAYYHSCMRNLFVGALCSIALFLFAYEGYDRKGDEILTDSFLAKVAGVAALGVALCPVAPTGREGGAFHYLHLLSAFVLFVCLILFTAFVFTRRGVQCDPQTGKLDGHARVYVGCAIGMSAAIGLIGIYLAFGRGTWLERCDPVFWLEWFALWAFSASWLLKGDWIRFLVRVASLVPASRLDGLVARKLQHAQARSGRASATTHKPSA